MALHPIHGHYVTSFTGNTVEDLIGLLDTLEPAKMRDETQ